VYLDDVCELLVEHVQMRLETKNLVLEIS